MPIERQQTRYHLESHPLAPPSKADKAAPGQPPAAVSGMVAAKVRPSPAAPAAVGAQRASPDPALQTLQRAMTGLQKEVRPFSKTIPGMVAQFDSYKATLN